MTEALTENADGSDSPHVLSQVQRKRLQSQVLHVEDPGLLLSILSIAAKERSLHEPFTGPAVKVSKMFLKTPDSASEGQIDLAVDCAILT